MKKYNIAVLPGDGVGVETIAQGVRVLQTAQEVVGGFELDLQHYDVGVQHYLNSGKALEDQVFEDCKAADSIYLGALGAPRPGLEYVTDAGGTEVSGHAMFKLRFGLDLFAGVRPIMRWPNAPSALAGHDKIDFVLVRESTEGLFASYGNGIVLKDDVAIDTQVITRSGCERVFNYAFQLAKARSGRLGDGRLADGKKVVTCAQKANVFRSFAFYKKVFEEVAKNYPDIADDYAYIDAITLYLLQHPENYDVIVCENAHGDILSDMCAAFVGGMGMAPSGDIGLDHAMFQPAHGTAPTIVGQNIVNPIATILSGKMMLEWLGERNGDAALLAAAKCIHDGVYKTFEAGVMTSDLGGNKKTTEVADEVIRNMKLK